MGTVAELVAEVQRSVAALNAAVAVPGFDADVSDEVLHEVTVALHTVQSSLSVGACRVAQRWDARRVWAVGGYKSAASRLSADAMTSKATAARVLHRARVLSSMPATAEAVAQGVLSGDHLDLFARANTPARRDLFAEHEQTLVVECAGLRWHEAVRAVRYWCARADALLDSGSASPNPVPEADEHLHASPTLDDTVVLNGVLGAVSGEIVLNELDRLADLVYLADQKAGIERTGSQRRVAALVEMARRSASTPADARRPKPLFTVHVGDETARHLCELGRGTVIRPEQLTAYLDDALMETILFDGPSTVLTVSQQQIGRAHV